MRTTWGYWGIAAALSTLLVGGCEQTRSGSSSNAEGKQGGNLVGSDEVADGLGSGGSAGAGGAGASAGAGGAGGQPSNDACNGEPIALAPGSVLITGTLIGAQDDLTTFCADVTPGADNPDVVYELHVSEELAVRILLEATGFDPAISLRLTSCASEAGGDACLDFGDESEGTRVSLTPGTYWLVVDSADGNAGDFTLDLTATLPFCGDGVVSTGEACDNGGGAPDDGCNDPGTPGECQLGEAPIDTSLTQCPGSGPSLVAPSPDSALPVITRLGPYNNGSGSHSHQNDTTADMYQCGWAAIGPENVHHVVPQADGTLYARIGYDDAGNFMCDVSATCGDFILYARGTSCEPLDPPDASQQLACADIDPNEVLTLQFPVTAGSDYWVFVDGLDDEWGIGPYYLELWLVE